MLPKKSSCIFATTRVRGKTWMSEREGRYRLLVDGVHPVADDILASSHAEYRVHRRKTRLTGFVHLQAADANMQQNHWRHVFQNWPIDNELGKDVGKTFLDVKAGESRVWVLTTYPTYLYC